MSGFARRNVGFCQVRNLGVIQAAFSQPPSPLLQGRFSENLAKFKTAAGKLGQQDLDRESLPLKDKLQASIKCYHSPPA